MHVLTRSDGLFWGGSRWSDEYPDAVKYQREERAVYEARALARAEGRRVFVVRHYGQDNQATIAEIVPGSEK